MNSFFEDLKVYNEGLLAQGFWALQFHRLGHARFKYESKWIRRPWGVFHLVLSKFSQIFFGIFIGDRAKIGKRLVIEHFGTIIVHGDSEIGDDCRIRQGVTIGNRQMDKPLDAPKIGSRVNIGAGAKILGNIVIGDDVDIGANAVVISDVPSSCIAVGIPAKIKPKKA